MVGWMYLYLLLEHIHYLSGESLKHKLDHNLDQQCPKQWSKALLAGANKAFVVMCLVKEWQKDQYSSMI